MPADTCSVCGGPILVMAYKGTGVCGHQCSKARDQLTEATNVLRLHVPSQNGHKDTHTRGNPNGHGTPWHDGTNAP